MVHQSGNQFKNQNGIQIKKKERKTEKKRKEEKASQPRLLGLLGPRQPAQPACQSPFPSSQHARAAHEPA